MRALRTIAGLLLAAVGVVLLVGGVGGWLVGQHRDPTGWFTAELAPIHSDGYAIVVPDVTAAAQRHGAARWLGAGDLRVTAHSPYNLVLALARSAEVSRYLDGVAHTEITGIGYASGAQPVSLRTVAGTGSPGTLPSSWPLTMDARAMEWSMDSDIPLSLVVVRSDGRAGLTATLEVGLRPASWGLLVGGLLAGAAVVLGGAAYLVWPGRRREVVVAVEGDRVVDVADRIAEGASTGRFPREFSREQAGASYVHTAT